jgi:endonuclease YncB( thermonuclease family)
VACESLPCPCKGSGAGKKKPKVLRFKARVIEVVDGDTLKVRRAKPRRRYTVRLLGIDTPEVYFGEECGGARASAVMKRQASGRRVLVRTDPRKERRDVFGRPLAYLERGKRRIDLGRLMVARGWARVFVVGRRFSRLRAYRKSQRRARRASRGVWSLCGGRFHQPL